MSKANEMIDRYVYDVTRRLPETQRSDIEKELRTLIDDMLNGKDGLDDVVKVLMDLGRPAELAAKYRGGKRYLIGPELFGTYELIVKIVLGCVAFGMLVAHAIINITTPPDSVFVAIVSALGAMVMALFQAFGIVTLIFVCVERYGKGEKWIEMWHPRDLPDVPMGSEIIKKSEPIVSLVFSGIFLLIIVTMPWLFGVGFGLPTPWIPIFNLEFLASIIGLVVLSIAAGALKEVLRLVIGRYNIKLALGVLVLNIITLILTIVIVGNPALWNANFLMDMQAATGAEWFTGETATAIWRLFPTIIIVLTVIGTVTDTATTLYRGIKHSVKSAA